MLRKVIATACFALLLGGESACLLGRFAAALDHQRGQRGFFRNHLRHAWSLYGRALALGADPDRIEIDQVELLLFGLDQEQAGVKVGTALPAADAVRTGLELVAHRLEERPLSAYEWSLVSDLYLHAARLRRKEEPLDLSRLSETPSANLLPDEWRAIGALERAAALEPRNYLFHDLHVELLLGLGLTDQAVEPCRRAVEALPQFEPHRYLVRRDLPAPLVEAALRGFDAALQKASLIPPEQIALEAGMFLTAQGDDVRAVGYYRRAVGLRPGFFDAVSHLGNAEYRLRDLEAAVIHLREAVRLDPTQPWAYFALGEAERDRGNYQEAAEAFARARQILPDVRFFHALGETYERAGKDVDAERQFRAAANLNLGDPAAWSALLSFYLRHHDARRATETCQTLLSMRSCDELDRSRCAPMAGSTP